MHPISAKLPEYGITTYLLSPSNPWKLAFISNLFKVFTIDHIFFCLIFTLNNFYFNAFFQASWLSFQPFNDSLNYAK